jgi:hypothetical protein
MPRASRDTDNLKRAFKEVLVETLHEQREFLHEIFADVLEDLALSEAIREGRKTKKVGREEVVRVLEGKA